MNPRGNDSDSWIVGVMCLILLAAPEGGSVIRRKRSRGGGQAEGSWRRTRSVREAGPGRELGGRGVRSFHRVGPR
jgi:hypothetical protein